MPIDPDDNQTLRQRAEKVLSEAPEKPALISRTDLDRLVHELSVHQIELEMQNEELHRSRDQLEESRSEYTDLYDFAPAGYLTFDETGLVTRANLTACSLLGIERSCFLKQPLALFIHPDLNGRRGVPLDEHMATLTTTGRWDGEVIHITKGGHRINVLSRQALQRDEAGSPLAVLEINLDITEAKRLEQELRQAHKMEALGTLTGGIAHDFNNILASIIGFTELAESRMSEGSREEHLLRRVKEAGLRGRELVKQLLTYGRKAGQEKVPLQLGSLVNETMKLLRASIPSTVSVKVKIDKKSGFILADPTQVQQVLMNLCSNAAHAMREHGGTLEVELGEHHLPASDEMKPGPYLRLVVRDTGVGIPAAIIDRVFDPFFTTKEQGEGTGLGLSIVQGIVKQHEGYITVESEPGGGSTFFVYFPMVAERPKARTGHEEAIPTGRERVLFIDDEEALAEMGQEILTDLGYMVESKTSSREALAIMRLDPSRFDLVITDQTMPEMTGVDLAKEILAIRPDMPIIMCTGFSYTTNEESAKSAGIKAFTMKPLTKREIAKTIRKVLDG